MADRDQKKQDAQNVAVGSSTGKKGNVFDTMGNEGLKARVAEVEAETGSATSANAKQTLLDKVAKNAQATDQKTVDPQQATQLALKQEALAARDEVILQVQMLTSNADQLKQLQGCESIGQASSQVIEMVSQNVSDPELAALGAYSHHDLLQGRILSPESHLETRGLSAQARKMGAFAPVLWQLVTDQLKRSDIQLSPGAETPGSAVTQGSAPPADPRNLAAPLLRAAGVLSSARSSSVV